MHPLCMPVVAACTRPTHLPCHQHYEADDKAALQRPAVPPSQPQRVRACGVQAGEPPTATTQNHATPLMAP